MQAFVGLFSSCLQECMLEESEHLQTKAVKWMKIPLTLRNPKHDCACWHAEIIYPCMGTDLHACRVPTHAEDQVVSMRHTGSKTRWLFYVLSLKGIDFTPQSWTRVNRWSAARSCITPACNTNPAACAPCSCTVHGWHFICGFYCNQAVNWIWRKKLLKIVCMGCFVTCRREKSIPLHGRPKRHAQILTSFLFVQK